LKTSSEKVILMDVQQCVIFDEIISVVGNLHFFMTTRDRVNAE